MNSFFEEVRVQGKDLTEKVESIVREGNVRRIIIRDEQGNTFIEIPLTVAAVSVLALPVLAALGALAALVANFSIVLERARPDAQKASSAGTTAGHAESGNRGATEDQVNMQHTVPQRIDPQGKNKIEDLAGTGGHDSQGG